MKCLPILFCFLIVSIQLSSTEISSTSFLLKDILTKKILNSKNTESILPIASITKLFTSYYSLNTKSKTENFKILLPSTFSKINPKAAKLNIDDIYSKIDLVEASLITSSNIASTNLAINIHGSEKDFVKKMNLYFKENFINTNLDDSFGLSEYTKSNIDDISKLLELIFRDEKLFLILQKKESIIKNQNGKTQILISTLEMNSYKNYQIFGKTGSTRKAGKCFAGFLKANNQYYQIILLNSKDIYMDIKFLIDSELVSK